MSSAHFGPHLDQLAPPDQNPQLLYGEFRCISVGLQAFWLVWLVQEITTKFGDLADTVSGGILWLFRKTGLEREGIKVLGYV